MVLLTLYVLNIWGMITMLEFPYPRDVSEPPLYGTVTVQGEMGRNKSIKEAPTLTVRSALCYSIV